MNETRYTGTAPRTKAGSWWRYAAIGILTVGILGFASALDAKKPPKDPPPDPDPPPVVEDGVIYGVFKGDWGNGPQEFWQMDPNGENWQLLFTVDRESDFYSYEMMAASKHTYGLNNSRIFACAKVGTDDAEGDNYIDVDLNGGVITSLVIVDESNTEIIDVLENTNIGMSPWDNKFVWYDNDRKLVIVGREVTQVDHPDPSPIRVQSDWNTLGIYTIDLIFDSNGDIIGSGPPTLINWTHDWLVADANEYYIFPFMAISDFAIEAREGAPDRIYFTMELDPGNWANPDSDLFRAELEDLDFTHQLEWLSVLGMEGLELNPVNTVISGGINDGGDQIAYYHIDEGYSEIIMPSGPRGTEWGAPQWSPSGENIIFGYGVRTPSLSMKESGTMRATNDFENITKIYKQSRNVRGGFFGWRSLP